MRLLQTVVVVYFLGTQGADTTASGLQNRKCHGLRRFEFICNQLAGMACMWPCTWGVSGKHAACIRGTWRM